jgi:hypothetical protein
LLGHCPSNAQEQEQKQNVTAAPLASAGNRSSARNNAITGEVRRHGGDQRHDGEGKTITA